MVNSAFLDASNVKVYTFNGSESGEVYRCYPISVVEEKGLWQELNPMAQALPLFLLQLILLTALNRIVVLILKPFRQPTIVAELLAGILGGNSALLLFKSRVPFLKAVFSISTVLLLETFGNLGLIYSLFLVGLEIDLSAGRQIGKRVFSVAAVGTVITFAFGVFMYYVCLGPVAKTYPTGSLFWGFAVCVNGLPVVADILACLKLLNADVGRTAMSSALVGNNVSWTLLVVILACLQNISALWVILSITGFIFLCIFVIKPAILKLSARKRDGDELSESNVCIILTVVLACGFLTDMLGLTSLVGAFILGLVLPYEVFGNEFTVFLQGFVTYFFVPIYFTLVGFRFQVFFLAHGPPWWLTISTIALLSVSKFVITMCTSYFLDSSFHDRLTIGLLTNAKGLLAIVAITIGHDHHAMDDIGFAIMLIVIVITTASSTPLISFINSRTRRLLPSKHRSLQKLRPETELRILACVHEHHTVAGIINLLESCYATRRSPICIFALQLIELTKQTAALLMIQRPNPSSSALSDCQSNNTVGNQTEHLTDAFVNLERESQAFFVHPLTVMSAYDTMHEDICFMAEDKRVTLVLLPFHKRQTIHNRMEDSNPSHKDVNDNVLAHAPCSIGILVDRGFGINSDENSGKRRLIMIFIGGPDDREALAYAARMGSHPSVILTVVRLIPDQNVIKPETHDGAATVMIYTESEKQLDDTYVSEFRNRTANNNSILYLEKVSNNGNQTVEILRSLGGKFDLYVVGRGIGVNSPLTAGLADWGECPELGAIGDLLLTSEFASASSVLVVQQYVELKGYSSVEEPVNTGRLSVSSKNTVHESRRQSRPHFDRFAEERDIENRL